MVKRWPNRFVDSLTDDQLRFGLMSIPCIFMLAAVLWINSQAVASYIADMFSQWSDYGQYTAWSEYGQYRFEQIIGYVKNVYETVPWTGLEIAFFIGAVVQIAATIVFLFRPNQSAHLSTSRAAFEAGRRKLRAFLAFFLSYCLRTTLLDIRPALIVNNRWEKPIALKLSELLIFYRIGSATYA